MPLLRSQQVWVFNRLSEAGFDPRDFELVPNFWIDELVAPALLHKSSGFFFAFRRHPEREGFWVAFEPASETEFGEYGTGGWEDVVAPSFALWLSYLSRETEAPDLWGELRRERDLIGGPTAGAENTPFSLEEQTEIRSHLEEAKQLVRANYALTEGQFETLETRLDYLADAVGRLGRVDWREVFVGSMLGLVLQGVVAEEPVRDVMLFVTRAVGHMFGFDVPGLISG